MTRPFRLALALILLIALAATTALAQKIEFTTLGREAIEARLRDFSVKNEERESKLNKMFEGVGCRGEQLQEQAVKGSGLPNLICTAPGATDSIIIVGAHFDHVDVGDGIVDNWSGASLLPSLYQSLRATPRQHTFVFIGFTDEEKGLVGSRFYARNLPSDLRSKTQAMVDIDSLGLSPTKVWVSRSDRKLVQALADVAHSMKISVTGVNADRVAEADATPFVEKKIPTIMIHSVTQETLGILHSKQDKLATVNMDDYYDTYRLLAAYLAYLDQTLAVPAEQPQQEAGAKP